MLIDVRKIVVMELGENLRIKREVTKLIHIYSAIVRSKK